MLFECSCEATKTLISDAITNGYALRPKADTPLAELVKTTTVVPMTDLTAKLGEKLKAIPVEQLAEGSNNSMHNGWLDQVSDRAAAILNRRIEIMRTTVIPVIADIAESVQKAVANVPAGSTVQNIERYFACDMINVPSFMSDVQRNTPGTYLSPDKYTAQEPKSQAELLTMLKVGNQAVDTALGVAINHIGSDSLWLLWDSLFVDRSKSTAENYLSFDQAVMNRNKGLDNAILIFMFTNLIQGEDITTLKQYREGAAYWIARHAEAYNREIASKILIRERMTDTGGVQVNGQVYTEFLQRKGTAELVLGAAADGTRYNTIDAILENERACMRSFATVRNATTIENTLNRTAAFRAALGENFMRSFKNDRNEAENAYFEKHPGDESAVISKLEQTLPLTSPVGIDDIYRSVATLVCNTRFFYMDCQCFLDAIERACKDGLPPEEAQVQAILEEIAYFVASMVTC